MMEKTGVTQKVSTKNLTTSVCLRYESFLLGDLYSPYDFLLESVSGFSRSAFYQLFPPLRFHHHDLAVLLGDLRFCH